MPDATPKAIRNKIFDYVHVLWSTHFDRINRLQTGLREQEITPVPDRGGGAELNYECISKWGTITSGYEQSLGARTREIARCENC